MPRLACGSGRAGVLARSAPWSVYASVVAGSPVPVSSGGASNLYVGTYLPGEGSMFGLKHAWAQGVAEMHPRYRGMRPHQIPQLRVIDAVAAERPGLSREGALRAGGAREPAPVRDRRAGGVRRPWPCGRSQRLWLELLRRDHRNRREWVQALHLACCSRAASAWPPAWPCAAGARRSWGRSGIVVLYVTAMNAVLVSEARHNLPLMPLVAAGGAAGLAMAAARVRRPRPILEPAGEAITVRRLTPAERATYAEREPDEVLVR